MFVTTGFENAAVQVFSAGIASVDEARSKAFGGQGIINNAVSLSNNLAASDAAAVLAPVTAAIARDEAGQIQPK